jgi:putative hydrolase of HD superfamily
MFPEASPHKKVYHNLPNFQKHHFSTTMERIILRTLVQEGACLVDTKRYKRIIDFLFLVDQVKNIERAGYVGGEDRHENDAEHMWHTALWAMLLHREIGFSVDLGHVLSLILVHDLVEIYAGDTYAYDEKGVTTQNDRELKAAKKLFSQLPEDLGTWLHDLWQEFEAAKTPEARFAKALDHLQGFSQNCISMGRSWKENGISRERTFSRTELPHRTDPALAEIVESLYEIADNINAWPKEQ